ncbi:MBL fold metallo-hydrolase [Acutalibacter sp. 1XD8-33]|uniref:MBL fold metallo-hydrolase n=1 Tax=Acutalibacter sp. 1XD8-33 TaxID=2320081 RepID=UPI001313F564|nr:MBL fold metallo-hydrolase [Acutalibacter sp. 1XD8-33]
MSQWKEHMAENDVYAAALAGKPHETCPADPYVLVFQNPEIPGVRHLFFDGHSKGTGTWMHLIEGEDRALLIDTAFGVGDLKALVETLTDKPCDVALTHFHGDHSAGAGQFGKVYCHKYDAPYLRDSIRSGHRLLPAGDFYRPEDVQPLDESLEIGEMEEGFRLVLGPGHEVEAIHMPGHAAGGTMFLDHSTGALFSGDAILSTPTLILDRFPAPHYPEYMTVTAFRNAIRDFLPRLDQVKALYPGHGRLGMGPELVTDMLACCEAMIAAPEEFEEYDYVDDPAQRRIKCVGQAMVVYSPSRI